MEIFLGVVIIVLLLSIRKSVLKKVDGVESKLDGFMLHVEQNQTKVKPSIVQEATVRKVEPKQPKPKPIIQPEPERNVVQKQPALKATIKTVQPKKVEPVQKAAVMQSQKVKKPKKSFSGWEKFIGENLLNKIGIGILVLGIGYFVKFAIDKNWIGEVGRVGIGVLSSGILLGVAYRLRKTFRAFSSVLTGGAIASLYFSIYLGFAEYGLFSPAVTFVLMLLITAFSAILSLTYDRIELAVIALIGGLGTPLMVSTGNGNYVVLFIYLIVLNGGMLAIAFKKKWKLVNVLSLIGTVLMTGGWLIKSSSVDGDYKPLLALFFGAILFLEFFLMNVFKNIKQKIKFKAFDFSLLLANTALFYAFGMVVLHNPYDGGLKGVFTIALAVFNFGFAYVLRKKNGVDKNFVYLLIGLVLTLGSLAAPIQLEGNQITLFWAAEMCLLLWLSQKSNLKLIKLGSVVLFGATLISLFMDWNQYAGTNDLKVVVNRVFITGVSVVAALVVYAKLLNKETEGFLGMKLGELKRVTQIVALLLTYAVGHLELYFQMNEFSLTGGEKAIWNAAYLIGFVTLFIAFAQGRMKEELKLAVLPVGLAVIGSYLFYFQDQFSALRHPDAFQVFNVHYVLTALIGGLLFYIHKMVKESDSLSGVFNRALKAVVAFVVVVLASQELNHICIEFFSNHQSSYDVLAQVRKAGYALVWGVLSFVFMFIGIKKQNRDWRLISLALFSLTLVKLFTYDIRGISEGGKIAAFIGLGVILLTVSFMYQKVKDLIFTDDSKTTLND